MSHNTCSEQTCCRVCFRWGLCPGRVWLQLGRLPGGDGGAVGAPSRLQACEFPLPSHHLPEHLAKVWYLSHTFAFNLDMWLRLLERADLSGLKEMRCSHILTQRFPSEKKEMAVNRKRISFHFFFIIVNMWVGWFMFSAYMYKSHVVLRIFSELCFLGQGQSWLSQRCNDMVIMHNNLSAAVLLSVRPWVTPFLLFLLNAF